MKINYIDRNHNVITQENTLEKLYVFNNFPIYIGCTDKPQSEDVTADLSLAICQKTGVMQLDKVLPLEVVYGDYHSEALGPLWNEHHLSFVEFLIKYNSKNILEIGGSNGFIAKESVKKNKNINKWIMVEPAPAYGGDSKIEVIEKSFDENFIYDGKVDCIVHSHTFEHIYEPGLFMNSIGRYMKIGDFQIFSVPNLYKYLLNKQANWINFEHTVFLTEYYIDFLLNKNGLEILEKKYFYEHSIFYATKKIRNEDKSVTITNKYKENKKLFNDYINFYKHEVAKYNDQIKKFSGKIYLFGAHIFSQFLVLNGLTGNIIGVLDNSKIKKGKRLYGTSLTVFAPDVIKDEKDVMVILKAGAYQKEVKDQLLSLNPRVIILE